MARRGETLRQHIIDVAKNAFLETGFERTSMDAIAARAETSKRSLYAHFATKDALFLAVVERSHELFGGRMQTPDHYSADPVEATALFCGRFLQMLGWAPILRTCRMGITEAEHLPAAAAKLHEVFFGTTTERLAAYLGDRYGVDAPELAAQVLGTTIYPAFPRALFGLDKLRDDIPDEATIEADVDMATIRRSVEAVLGQRSVSQSRLKKPATAQ
jgi:TetR/AcrR family transcriptional regulator of autoinduction and epiphytic fitness